MPAESVRAALAMLTAQDGEAAAQVFAKYAGLSADGKSLEALVRENLTRNGKTAQLRESLLETLHAGGAVGESVPACLMHSGLLGWQ